MNIDCYKAIIFDDSSINFLSSLVIDEDWFSTLEIPLEYKSNYCLVKWSDYIYFLSKEATSQSKFLIINNENKGFLKKLDKKDLVTAFYRSIVFSLSQFDACNFPGHSWGKFAKGNITSFFALRLNAKNKTRLYFNTNLFDSGNIYLYKVSETINIDNSDDSEDEVSFNSLSELDNVLEKRSFQSNALENTELSRFGVELKKSDGYIGYSNSTLEEWYDKKLTSEQRTFVDKEYENPVRLKGAAGTGKTLALTVKFLRDIYKFEEEKKQKRLLFLTHSYSTYELINKLMHSMDLSCRFKNLNYVNYKISSIYDFAQDILNYNLQNIYPISNDGKEGRELQYEILTMVLTDALKDIRFAVAKLNKCSISFQNYCRNKSERHAFKLDLLNEFSSILDTENIFLGSSNSQTYIEGTRESWQMKLDTDADKLFVLELHNLYRNELKELNVLSMDQLIADLTSHLNSHLWNRKKDEEGYDAIFVDELHYFSKPERMIFNQLCRLDPSSNRLPIFMAYDVKQSVNDIYLNSVDIANIIKSTKVGTTQLVELTKVFRYTPEIATFLEDIDGVFPTLDLADEWNKLKLSSSVNNGVKPELTIYEKNINLIDSVFGEAVRLAKRNKENNIAILCINPELFSKYLNVGRINKMYEAVTSREETIKIGRAKGIPIFSMPEYVAGLQFDIVYLIHVDRNELPDSITHNGAFRRLVSQVYLGASRAQKILKLASSEERRGYSSILESALKNESLVKR